MLLSFLPYVPAFLYIKLHISITRYKDNLAFALHFFPSMKLQHWNRFGKTTHLGKAKWLQTRRDLTIKCQKWSNKGGSNWFWGIFYWWWSPNWMVVAQAWVQRTRFIHRQGLVVTNGMLITQVMMRPKHVPDSAILLQSGRRSYHSKLGMSKTELVTFYSLTQTYRYKAYYHTVSVVIHVFVWTTKSILPKQQDSPTRNETKKKFALLFTWLGMLL